MANVDEFVYEKMDLENCLIQLQNRLAAKAAKTEKVEPGQQNSSNTTEALGELQIVLPPCATSFESKWNLIATEIRLKMWKEAAATARNTHIHQEFWECGGSGEFGGYVSIVAANFEAWEVAKRVCTDPIPYWEYCECETNCKLKSWLDTKTWVLYSLKANEMLCRARNDPPIFRPWCFLKSCRR
jgi:hypothetical protein